MNDFFEQIWLDNPIKSYFIVLAVILLVLAFKRFISRYFAGLLFKLLNRIWKDLDKRTFIDLVFHPIGMFLLILVSIIALHKLKFPDQLNIDLYGYAIKSIIHCIATIILIVSFIWVLLRMIDFISFILKQKAVLSGQTSNQLVIFFRDFFKVIVSIIGILMILKFAFRFNIGNLLTGLSIVGAAVALALRESLENLIASFIIFFDKPFTLGDVVKVQNITGNVERIGLRSTRIRTDQKTYITVPNKQMVDSILDNLSLRTQLKGELRLQVALSTSSADLEKLIAGTKKILQHKDVISFTAVMNDITINAFLINADYFTRTLTYNDFIAVKEELNLQVLKLLEELKIEIAGARTDIRIDGMLNEKQSLSS